MINQDLLDFYTFKINYFNRMKESGKNKLLKQIEDGSKSMSSKQLQDTIDENSINNCKRLTLSVSSMNRNEFLINSLRTWIKFPFKKIVIVDWSSTIPVLDYIKEHLPEALNHNVVIHRDNNKPYYEHSKVRNLKISLCEGWILCIDADVMLNNDFSKHLFFKDDEINAYYINSGNTGLGWDRGVYGTSIFHKDIYDKVGGCNEEMHGWGYEDADLYTKFENIGCKERPLRVLSLNHQPHDDTMRTINTKYDNIWESLTNNSYISTKSK
jgi:hypothetical protein